MPSAARQQAANAPDHHQIYLTAAFRLGALPLVTGSAIFILWCATNWDWLRVAGLLTIVLGVFAFLAGGFCLLMAIGFGLLEPDSFRCQHWLRTLAAALALSLNFPACVTIVNAVNRLDRANGAFEQLRQSTVRVVNATDKPIDELTIVGYGSNGLFRSIQPGGAQTAEIGLPADRDITVVMTQSGKTIERKAQVHGGPLESSDDIFVVSPGGTLQAFRVGRPLSTYRD